MPWWRTLYSHEAFIEEIGFHDDATTEREISMIQKLFPLNEFSCLIDMGCGWGRLTMPLAKKGYTMFGVDTSPLYIRWAKSEPAAQHYMRTHVLTYVRGNIRRWRPLHAADGIIVMHTTFGYFNDDGNIQSLKTMTESIRHHGRLLLDMTNYHWVMNGGFPDGKTFTKTYQNGRTCVTRYRFDRTNKRIIKHIEIQKGLIRHRSGFSIRVYAIEEIRSILHSLGLDVIHVFGDYAAHAPVNAASQRQIVLAQKL